MTNDQYCPLGWYLSIYSLGRQIGTVLIIGQHCPLGQGCIRKYPYIIGMLTMLNLIPPCREGEITCLICIDNIFLMILIQHNW